jgi:hypothetical protein
MMPAPFMLPLGRGGTATTDFLFHSSSSDFPRIFVKSGTGTRMDIGDK